MASGHPVGHYQVVTALGEARFEGPYSGGPPPEDLVVEGPPLEEFGLNELSRLMVVLAALLFSLARAGQRWLRDWWGTGLSRRRQPEWASVLAKEMVEALVRLGPTFVKLGQVVTSSPGLFPKALVEASARCLDEVPPFDAALAAEMIRGDFGVGPEEAFASFDPRPLSAASVGQVHPCVLRDGREAVVKLQRPGIRVQMTVDLRILYQLARAAARLVPPLRRAGAVELVRELHSVTCEELNPALEAYRQDRFRRNLWAFGDNRWVTAPEVYWDYCGPHVICMERMHGVPMDDFEAIRARGLDGRLILRRGAKSWLEAVALHGPFHADLHAGNLWVLEDGRSAYLDFGIMGELPQEYRQLIRDLFYTFIFDGDYTRVAKAYRGLGVVGPDMGSDEELGLRFKLVLDPLLRPSSEISLGEFIVSCLEMMKNLGLVTPRALVLFSKQLLYMERYIKGLAPDWQLTNDPFLVKNIFPEEAAAKAAALGLEFPD